MTWGRIYKCNIIFNGGTACNDMYLCVVQQIINCKSKGAGASGTGYINFHHCPARPLPVTYILDVVISFVDTTYAVYIRGIIVRVRRHTIVVCRYRDYKNAVLVNRCPRRKKVVEGTACDDLFSFSSMSAACLSQALPGRFLPLR